MDIRFDGKRALVTGAGRGIGRGIAKKLLECGAETVALSMIQEELDSLKAECPEITICCLDITSDWSLVRKTVEDLGHFDLLVNNAGTTIKVDFVDATEDTFDTIFNTNVKALFNISQVVVKSMIAKKTGGAIVHISSIASKRAFLGQSVYAGSKSAVNGLTLGMALELAKHNIRTNCVVPTLIRTEMAAKNVDDVEMQSFVELVPMHRIGEIEEVADAVLFLLSDRAAFCNGASLAVDGGHQVRY